MMVSTYVDMALPLSVRAERILERQACCHSKHLREIFFLKTAFRVILCGLLVFSASDLSLVNG